MPPLKIVGPLHPDPPVCERCATPTRELHMQSRHPVTDARIWCCSASCYQALSGAPMAVAA